MDRKSMLPLPKATYEVPSVEALFRAHAPFIASFLRRLGVPDADLDDAVQEVFVVAHRKGGYVPGPAHPRTWLAAIALHVAQAARRQSARRERPASPALELMASVGDDPHTRLDAQRGLDRVQRALDKLPIELRAAFVLYEIEGESCEAIASVLNVPTGTVYSRLHHARQRFLKAHQALLDPVRGTHAQRSIGGER